MASQQEMRIQTQPLAGNSDRATMVRIQRAAGDDARAVLSKRLCEQKFQFANLIKKLSRRIVSR